jgi:hypothetical protein
MLFHSATGLEGLLRDCLEVRDNGVKIIDAHRLREERIDALVYNAMFQPSERVRYFLSWLIRQVAAGNAIYPASLQGLYTAAARGQTPTLTLPAISLRVMTYAGGRAAFRAARETGAGALAFNLDAAAKPAQSPLDYATCLLAAALREGYEGPLFLQANFLHERPMADEPAHSDELERLKELVEEALNEAFFNLELDATRMENLTLPDLSAQEQACYADCAELASFVRQTEPGGVGSAIGIQFNSRGDPEHRVQRLRAFMTGFETEFTSRAGHVPGISKFNLNIRGKVDLDIAADFAEVARREYWLPTSVSMDSAAMPDDVIEAVADLPFVGAHLGSRLEDRILDHLAFPGQLRQAMQHWIDTTYGEAHQPGEGDEDFYRAMRPLAYEQFKREMWDLPRQTQEAIMADLQTGLVEDIKRLKVEDSIHLAIDTVNIQQTELPRPIEGYFQDAETTYRDILDQLG